MLEAIYGMSFFLGITLIQKGFQGYTYSIMLPEMRQAQVFIFLDDLLKEIFARFIVIKFIREMVTYPPSFLFPSLSFTRF